MCVYVPPFLSRSVRAFMFVCLRVCACMCVCVCVCVCLCLFMYVIQGQPLSPMHLRKGFLSHA